MNLNTRKVNKFKILSFICLLSLTGGCKEEHHVPKPIGYFRIDIPEHAYVAKNFGCPFSFEIGTESRLVFFDESKSKCWFNITYPNLDATLHITYKPIAGNLREYLEESRGLAYEHQAIASNISPSLIDMPEKNVFGLTYDLGGKVASPFQFYLTDSVNHFLRGSLYFNARPNPDSLQPALDYIREDMMQFTESFEWLNKPN